MSSAPCASGATHGSADTRRQGRGLRRCIARIEQRRAATPEDLQADLDRQDIISLDLTRAVQLCFDIAMHLLADTEEPMPATMGGAFEALARRALIPGPLSHRLRSAVGFRNIVVHSYQSIDWAIDWAIVHALTQSGVADFKDFARAIAALIDEQ